MDILSSQLEKARIYAYLSFIGLTIFPMAEIAMSCISISILNRLNIDDTDTDALEEKERLRTISYITCTLSVIILALTSVLMVYGIVQFNEVINTSSTL